MIPVLEQQMLTFYVSPEVIPKIQSLNEEYTDTLEIEEENDIQEEESSHGQEFRLQQ